jgi:hypothetical protein
MIGLAAAGLGLIQGGIGAFTAAKNQKKLERMQSPVYKKNKGILDYYNTALSRYQTPATETSFYKKQQQDIGRNTSQGISALAGRGGATGGLSRLIQGANDAALNANVAAEGMRDQRFGQLAGATQMQAGEDRAAYQFNKLAPFERKYNLTAQKAAGGNQIANAGLTNVFNGLNAFDQSQMMKDLYATAPPAPAAKAKARRARGGIGSGITY